MLGSRINMHSLRHTFGKAKAYIGNVYGKTKGMLGDLDSGVRAMKDVYSIASPAMGSLFGKHFEEGNKHVTNALSGYEDIKTRVMDTDENVRGHYSAIVGDLKKKNIDIGL
jgi:hypothetical protein